MNNSNMNFDPMTGQPIQNSNQTITPVNNEPVVNSQPGISVEPPVQPQNTAINNQAMISGGAQIQNELQNIPTVGQDKEAFINNVQTINQEKQEEKKEGVNFVFIIILFIIILVAIYFLFPMLLKYI